MSDIKVNELRPEDQMSDLTDSELGVTGGGGGNKNENKCNNQQKDNKKGGGWKPDVEVRVGL